MEDSPIINRIGQVFIPVSDIKRSAEWYNRLFGVEGGHLGHHDQIYDVPMQGEARLSLDAHKPLTGNSVQPICFFWTGDISATREFLVESDVELVGDVQDAGSLYFLIFKDPDDNLLMVCEPKDDATRARAGLC
jgi:catechol 2,3-dioxygenase-like lactoylglutathione lyase family enzyme